MALVFNILVDHHDRMIYIIHSRPSSHMSISIHPLLSHKSIQVIFVITFEIQLPLQYCPSIIGLLSYQYVIPKVGRKFTSHEHITILYKMLVMLSGTSWMLYNYISNIAKKSNKSES
jgi:hypothetical protein